jgi:hypothetical protein
MSQISPALPAISRDGPLLVLHKAATLPPRCVTSGEPAEGVAEEFTLAHADPGTAMTGGIAGGALGGLLGMLIARWMGEKYPIAIPQSESARSTRWWTGTIGLVMAVGGIGGAVACVLLNPPGSDIRLFGALGSLLAAIFGIAFWIDSLQPLRIAKAEGDHIWLAGAGEEYLKTLPEWPKKDPTQA